jgi:hypothetical protein
MDTEVEGGNQYRKREAMETPTLRPKRDRRAQPRTLPHRGARTTPEDGDIIVREEQREGIAVYVLHTAPGADQQVLRNRGEAIAEVLESAKRENVRAWRTDEGYDFTLLEDFRAVTTIEDVLSRLRVEFADMPGLRLKAEQVQRLCSVERAVCQMVLDRLVDEKFLCAKPDGHYARVPDGPIPRPQPARTDLKTEPRFVRAS